MNYLKDLVIKWAIKQIVADGKKTTYAGMRYLEDVVDNEMGEHMYIFSHTLVPIDMGKLRAYNARLKAAEKEMIDEHPKTN